MTDCRIPNLAGDKVLYEVTHFPGPAEEQMMLLYPVCQFRLGTIMFVHPVDQVAIIWAVIEVLARLPLLLAVWTLTVQDVLDMGHSGSGGADTNALLGLPYLEHSGLIVRATLIDFQET
jgi:hypothetical protein